MNKILKRSVSELGNYIAIAEAKLIPGVDKKKFVEDMWDKYGLTDKIAKSVNIRWFPYWLKVIVINNLRDLIIESAVAGMKN